MSSRLCHTHEKTQPLKREIAFFAVRTRLELATYGVTGRYSNQLNYRTRSGLPLNGRSGLRPKGLQTRLFLKAGAKVLLFSDMTKFFGIFFQKKCIFMKKGYLSAAF